MTSCSRRCWVVIVVEVGAEGFTRQNVHGTPAARNPPSPSRMVHPSFMVGPLDLYGSLPEPWRYLTLVGLIPFGSALTGFCPVRPFLRSGP